MSGGEGLEGAWDGIVTTIEGVSDGAVVNHQLVRDQWMDMRFVMCFCEIQGNRNRPLVLFLGSQSESDEERENQNK